MAWTGGGQWDDRTEEGMEGHTPDGEEVDEDEEAGAEAEAEEGAGSNGALGGDAWRDCSESWISE